MKEYLTDPKLHWIYPQEAKPPTGIKLSLLTKGGVQVTGVWVNDGSYIAWQALFKRDKDKEKKFT